MAGSGPTEELAGRDAYLSEAEGSVLQVTPEGVFLDRTVFYARGGGQPGDVGVIRWDGGEVDVVDTIRHDGMPLHVVAEGSALPDPGTPVHGVIDWERRYRTMRTHTALHALSGVVFRDFGAKVTGGNMEPGIARMDFELDGISVEFGHEVERRLNQELTRGYPTEVIYMAREEALKDYPRIKCNVNADATRIYHLPCDPYYDRIRIEPEKGEFYAKTAAEAEAGGFRRARRRPNGWTTSVPETPR